MSDRLHALSELSTLFGPDASAREQKTARAEAPRREDVAMQNIHVERAAINGCAVVGSAGVDPVSLIREGIVRLSAAAAGAILRRCRYEKQTRDLKPAGASHVDVLADIMRRKQWRSRDQITFARLDGRLILINGHHRLTAQEKSGEDVEWTIVVHDCADADDVARLYYTFDTNTRGRSNETILAAYGAAEKLDVSKTTAEGLFRVAPLFLANFEFERTAQDVVANRVIDRRMEVVKAYAPEGRLWEKAIKKAPTLVKKKLLNQGALAVALTAFRYQPAKALDFFHGLAVNDGLRKGDPRHTYLNALLTGSNSGQSSFTARQAAVAWNAWAEGRSLSIIKIVEANSFRIVGTPVGR